MLMKLSEYRWCWQALIIILPESSFDHFNTIDCFTGVNQNTCLKRMSIFCLCPCFIVTILFSSLFLPDNEGGSSSKAGSHLHQLKKEKSDTSLLSMDSGASSSQGDGMGCTTSPVGGPNLPFGCGGLDDSDQSLSGPTDSVSGGVDDSSGCHKPSISKSNSITGSGMQKPRGLGAGSLSVDTDVSCESYNPINNTTSDSSATSVVDQLSPCYTQDPVMNDDPSMASVQPATALAVAQLAKDSMHQDYRSRSMLSSVSSNNQCMGQGYNPLQSSSNMYMQCSEPHMGSWTGGYHQTMAPSSGLAHIHAHQSARHLAGQASISTCNTMSPIHHSAQFLHGGHSAGSADAMGMNMNMHMSNHFPSHTVKFPV